MASTDNPNPPATAADTAATAVSPVVAPARPVATGLGLFVPLLAIVALLLVVLLALAGGARWLLFNEDGARWVLARAPMVQVKGFQGALLGERWQAEQVKLSWDGGKAWVTIDDLVAEGLRWTWRPHEHAWLALDAQKLSARSITVATGPPGPRPIPLPASITVPVQLAVAQVQVQTLQVDALAPMTQLQLQGIVLDPRPGALYEVAGAGLVWQGVQVQAQARLGTAAPLPITAQATLGPAQGGDTPAWAAVLGITGHVPQMQVQGTLRGVAPAGHAAPVLDVQAGLQVLQAWPLHSLALRTEALDLSALSPTLPQTLLNAQATLASSARNAPLTASVSVTNTRPGRWNERRLPVQRLTAELQGQLNQPERLELKQFELTLADATRAAGRWSGSALWQGHGLNLQTQLHAVTPQRLDSRAAAMALSGPVNLQMLGLPSPDPASTAAPPPPQMEWKIDLEGRLEAAPQPVRLQVEGRATDQRLDLTRLRATSGAATAELQGLLHRVSRGEWKLQTTGTLDNFDPLPWWPGAADSPWRRGPHRLSADWQVDLQLPANPDRLPAVALAHRVAGNGQLHLHDSVLAGVPLAADITLGYTQAAAPTSGSLHGEVHLGGNHLTLDGRGDPTGPGTADRLRAELKGDALDALAPLVRLVPALADWVPTSGTANATLAVDGRWPALRTEGTAQIKQLKAGQLVLANASANWRLDLGGQQTLALQADASGLRLGTQSVDQVRAILQGTLAEHSIQLSAAVPVAPAPELAQVLGVTAQKGTLAQLRARGAWLGDAAGGGRWQARIERVNAGAWDGRTELAASGTSWAESKDLAAELEFNADGRLVGLRADPGRLQLSDAVSLRWDEVKVDLHGEQPRVQINADIEPFALAPLLARAQPAMGWQGDLRLGARVRINAAEKVDADLVFERRDGDLHMVSPEGMQLLGLTEVRLALSVHDGVWLFNPVFKGRSLGEITGTARVRTTPEARWPHADAPVDGRLQAQVSDIGIWGAWVPPGWRLKGELRTTATLSGRFAQPQYSGQINGSGLGVRNLLQGVNVSDGELALRLDGDTATIEGLKLKGGDGSLTVTGGAVFGTEPTARLQIKAERFRVIGRVDRSVTASGNAVLTLSRAQGKLEGSIMLDEGLFDSTTSGAPTLDDDVTVTGDQAEAAAREQDPAAAKPRRNFVLGLDVDLGRQLHIKGHGLDADLRGKLRLTTPGGQLAVHGTINAEDGTYAAYGQKLTIERGIVAFSGAYDNPRLDVLALRPNTDNRVGVLITGNVLTPRVRLYSEPELTDSEKLSWLLLGRAPDGLGRADTALLQRAALALLSGEGEAPTDALLKSFGIDELSLRQGDGDTRETVVTLGKQLGRRWYLGYERGVNSTTGTWQLIYRIAQRFTLRAQSGLESSLDIIWVLRAQETPADAGMRKSQVVPP